jgi:hypothetical protein
VSEESVVFTSGTPLSDYNMSVEDHGEGYLEISTMDRYDASSCMIGRDEVKRLHAALGMWLEQSK